MKSSDKRFSKFQLRLFHLIQYHVIIDTDISGVLFFKIVIKLEQEYFKDS